MSRNAARSGRGNAARSGPGLRKIFVVFKTHFDIGFTGLVEEVLESYARVMIPRAIDACRQTAGDAAGSRFAWTLPAWPLTDSMSRLKGSPTGEELERLVAEGRIAWHALPFTTHTELFGLEDFIRGFYIGRALGERFGRRAVAAKMTDVPGHTRILPTLLASAGVLFLHLGCNACSTPPDVPFLFHWEGPDGSRVITMYSRGGYGTSLFPPPDWKLPVWLALQHTSDNTGPQTAAAVTRILSAARARYPDAEITVGSLDDFARALAALKPDLPVIRKDLADSWIHGAATMPAEVARLRSARNRLVSVESADAIRLLARRDETVPAGDLHAALSGAYERILLFGEHTWGMDTKIALNPPEFGGRVYDKARFQDVRASGKYERIRRSWSDKARFVEEAEEDLRRAGLILAGGEPAAPPAVPTRFEVVNHHLWQWSGLLKLGRFNSAVKVVQEPGEETLRTMTLDGATWTTVTDLPPLSATILRVEPGEEEKAVRGRSPGRSRAGKKLVMDNGMIRVEVSASAGMTALIHRAADRNWVDARQGIPFGGFRYDVYSRGEITAFLKSYAYDLEAWFVDDFGKPGYPESDHRTFVGGLAGVETERGPGWTRLSLLWRPDEESVSSLGNPARVAQRLTLFDEQPWVDMDIRLEDKQECPLLESGHVVFPLKAEKPLYAINKTGGVIDPARDIAKDANRLLYCCDRWVDVADGDTGVLLIPYDSPLFSIGSTAIERFDGSALPGAPALYFNLFNTQWGTNFPQWIGGNFGFRYRLIPHEGTWRSAHAWEHASAALQPPDGFHTNAADIRAGGNVQAGLLARGLLERPAKGLQTVTLKRSEAGDGIILRLQEPTGRGGNRALAFRIPAGAAAPRIVRCSLLEDEQQELPTVTSGDSLRLSFPVRPFEVLTLKLKF
ncbi:MAG: glycosyl hydrolase-related protein [Spirochaetia bacterium]